MWGMPEIQAYIIYMNKPQVVLKLSQKKIPSSFQSFKLDQAWSRTFLLKKLPKLTKATS